MSINTLVIGMGKHIYTRALITDEFPALLKEYAPSIIEKTCYWRIESIRWRDGIPEVDEATSYFHKLSEENPDESETDEIVFGAIRLGEDDYDYEFWGKPEYFDIHLTRAIESPI